MVLTSECTQAKLQEPLPEGKCGVNFLSVEEEFVMREGRANVRE